jgi:hypothetical protein
MLIPIIIGVVALAFGGFFAVRAATRPARKALPAGATPSGGLLERTVRDVRVEDIVQHDGKDWLVEGVMTYDEDGHTWRSARISDAGTHRWLLIGLDRGALLTLRILDDAKDVELTGYPPEQLDRSGVAFKLAQRGTATAALTGELGALPSHEPGAIRCRWWRYSAAGEKCILVEQWGETFRVLAGEALRPDDVELLQAT